MYQLESAANYHILSAAGCITLDGVDDADRFKAIQDAFSTVGVEEDAQMQVHIVFMYMYIHTILEIAGGCWPLPVD